MVQHVDAQLAVALEHRIHRAVSVDADHYRRRRIGHRTDRGGGDTAAARLAFGGDDVNGGRQTGHGIAKTQTLFI